jgi:peptidoglycan/xylan/chitin deacetylase (PgdA/CDA1 family)
VKRALALGVKGKEMEFVVETLANGEAMTGEERMAFNTVVKLACRGPDPALAAHALGILYAHKVITTEQRSAGEAYGKTYAMAIGRKRELGFDGHGHNDIDDDTLSEIEARHRANQDKLRKLGGRTMRLVADVCAYGQMPPWLVPDGRTTAGRDDRVRLCLGLNVLAGKDKRPS